MFTLFYFSCLNLTNMPKLREKKNIKPSKFGELLSNSLYERRFGPFFTSPVVARLDADEIQYIYGYDSIGTLFYFISINFITQCHIDLYYPCNTTLSFISILT